jgi:hypothetical protein
MGHGRRRSRCGALATHVSAGQFSELSEPMVSSIPSTADKDEGRPEIGMRASPRLSCET